MIQKIRKRNGKYVKFDINKIISSILNANINNEINEKIARKLAIKVVGIAEETLNHIPTVMDLNDIVEQVLLNTNYINTAKNFIIYKLQHEKQKQAVKSFTKELVNNYIDDTDWQIKENANTGFSLAGLNNYIVTDVIKNYWLNEVFDKEVSDAHKSGEIHFHDLGVLGCYCNGADLEDVLLQGFKGAEGKVESRAPKHFSSAIGIICNVMGVLANEIAGAVAFSNVDTYLAPFIRYDNLSYEEVKQQIQVLCYTLNYPSRVAMQSPFTNFTLDITCPNNFKDKAVIIGGEYQQATYKEFQKEMDMFNEAFFEVMMEGDAKGRVFTFPIITVNITKEFDWDNPNLANFWTSLVKYGLPTFANYVNSNMSPEDATSMCCRLRIDKTKLHLRGGGQFGASGLTGSTSVATINLNRIGFEAKDETEFFSILEKRMDISKKAITLRRKVIEALTEKGLYPYLAFYLRGVKARHGRYFANHFSTIGVCGGNECCLNFLDDTIGSKAGQEFMKKVLDFMNEKLIKYQEETGDLFNLEAVPAESTSYRLGLLDKKFNPDIITAGTEEVPYLSNSTALEVGHTEDLFEVLDLQNDLCTAYTGGSTVHLFIGEDLMCAEVSVLKELIKTICQKYTLPYFTITPTFSVCPIHGYLTGIHELCPKCLSGE